MSYIRILFNYDHTFCHLHVFFLCVLFVSFTSENLAYNHLFNATPWGCFLFSSTSKRKTFVEEKCAYDFADMLLNGAVLLINELIFN